MTPRLRLGSRWVSVLWAIPISVVLLLILVAVAKGLRDTAGVASFIRSYPGTVMTPHPSSVGIPWWARAEHFSTCSS